MPQPIFRVRVLAVVVIGLAVTGCSTAKSWTEGSLLGAVSSKLPFVSRSETAEESEVTSAAGPESAAMKGSLAMLRLAERHDRTEEAEKAYKAMTESHPTKPIAYHRLGVICAKDGRFQQAGEHFDRALELAPSDPVLLCDVGYYYYIQNRPVEAESALLRALELKPNDPTICNNLGLLLGEQGRYGDALTLFRRTGGEAEACASLAFVYLQQGEREMAKELYSRALTLDPQLRPAAEALAQLAEAEQTQERLAQRTPGRLSATRSDTVRRLASQMRVPAAVSEGRSADAGRAMFYADEAAMRPGKPSSATLRASFQQTGSPSEGRAEPASGHASLLGEGRSTTTFWQLPRTSPNSGVGYPNVFGSSAGIGGPATTAIGQPVSDAPQPTSWPAGR